MTTRWHDYETETRLHEAVGNAVMAIAEKAVAATGSFRIVLAGGSTPAGLYSRLASKKADWTGWQVYFGDERCLPAGHPDRNSTLAMQTWLRHVPIPARNIHFIEAELGPTEGASRYAALLRGVPDFDLVLLGLGEDGHTASLFPGHEIDGDDALPVFGAPKPPPMRISMSASRLSKTRHLFFLVAGESKREAVSAWLKGEPIPASGISPECGADVHILSSLMS